MTESPTKLRVLFVDDDPEACMLVEAGLRGRGYDVEVTQEADQAIVLLSSRPFDVLIADLRLKQSSGVELCHYAATHHPDVPVIILTGFGTVDAAITAMRARAFDFLTKPINLDGLCQAIDGANRHKEMDITVRRLPEATRRAVQSSGHELLGQSPAVEQVREMVARVAATDSTVLLQGESGTGKERVARMLHAQSGRAKSPFVAVNCAAIPANLLESELFGHVRGAFTGAVSERKGLFSRAHHGTLLLDEVGDMPSELQPKLLRALEEREIKPVGSDRSIAFDARIVAATHQNLEELVRAGSFREDLYYRINVVQIALPPLRDRGEDILLLASHFARRFGKKLAKPIEGFGPRAALRLLEYSWPGNVRELQNAVEQAVTLTRLTRIAEGDLPERVREHRLPVPRLRAHTNDRILTLSEIERRYIDHVLTETGGNKSQTARLLGVDRRTLHRKLGRRAEEGNSVPS